MTTPFWCLLIAVLLPYVLAGVGGRYKSTQLGSLDANEPRKQSEQLAGAGHRAVAAQSNAWEALAAFTAAVVVAHLAGADAGLSATASVLFILARVAHAIFYVQGLALPRSIAFLVGLGCCLWLFALAATA